MAKKMEDKKVIEELSNDISNFVYNEGVTLKQLEKCFFIAKKKVKDEVKALWDRVK